MLDLLCDTSKIQAYQHSTSPAKVPAGWPPANANLVVKETLKRERMRKNRGSEHEDALFFMEKNGMGQPSVMDSVMLWQHHSYDLLMAILCF